MRSCRGPAWRPSAASNSAALSSGPMDSAPELTPKTARRIFFWQLLFFGVLLLLACLENISTVLDDHARADDPLPVWKPAVWEGSSHLMVFLLIPVLSWGIAQFPITR